jgi:type VI protein secretion system component VasK
MDRLRVAALQYFIRPVENWDGFQAQVEGLVETAADYRCHLLVFPEEMMRIGPRLRVYVEKIFTPGPFTQHPPFVRGIYFTSSMQEGAELGLTLGAGDTM